MICFMFPGQPLLHDGKLPDDPDFKNIEEMAKEAASLDLRNLEWTAGESTDNVKLQIYGVAMSLYHTRRLRHQEIIPNLIAEHSMGIYPSLSASGSISERDALEITFRVGRCMASMGKTAAYGLGCFVGLNLEKILSIAENNGIYPANLNTSRHFLLSGLLANMQAAEAEALAAGAFSARTFPCDAPLHTPLMAEIEKDLTAIFSDYRYLQPAVPLVNHIDQQYLEAGNIAEFLMRELALPVYWEKTYKTLKSKAPINFLEVGAGDSLKKYNRWIDSESARSKNP